MWAEQYFYYKVEVGNKIFYLNVEENNNLLEKGASLEYML
jgi:hypothetical protein